MAHTVLHRLLLFLFFLRDSMASITHWLHIGFPNTLAFAVVDLRSQQDYSVVGVEVTRELKQNEHAVRCRLERGKKFDICLLL